MLVLVVAAGCTETLDPIEGTTSLRVELISPADPGSPENRLDDSARAIVVNISALDAQNELDTSLNTSLQIYAHFLGSLTPELQLPPLATVNMVDGQASNVQIDLPPTFGSTFLWVEDSAGAGATFATGTSAELWYRDPFIEDISRPIDEAAQDARERSPLEKKQVIVAGSRYGATGRLVVNGVYAQGYTLSDVQCADAAGTPPCVVGDYDSVFVFSFSRAENQDGAPILEGQFVDEFGGGISEFNGLTEVGFPSTVVLDPTVDIAAIPDPIVIDSTNLADPITLERVEASLVAIDGATVCPLDEDFETFGQWKLDLGQGCGDPDDTVNVISGGVAADFDPGLFTGQVLPRVVGTLRPINVGTFNVWIIYPRSTADIQQP